MHNMTMKKLAFIFAILLCLDRFALFATDSSTTSGADKGAYPHIESLLSRKSNYLLQQYLDEVYSQRHLLLPPL